MLCHEYVSVSAGWLDETCPTRWSSNPNRQLLSMKHLGAMGWPRPWGSSGRGLEQWEVCQRLTQKPSVRGRGYNQSEAPQRCRVCLTRGKSAGVRFGSRSKVLGGRCFRCVGQSPVESVRVPEGSWWGGVESHALETFLDLPGAFFQLERRSVANCF